MEPRILHVWNTAGVGSIIAKFTDRGFGTSSTVITRKAADKVGLTTYGTVFDDGPARFFLRALTMAGRADIVHVHSLDRLVPWLKGTRRVPVVLHYHGTDIEGRWAEKRPRWSRADFLAVSTPNLLDGAPPTAVHVPNPVDTDLFRPAQGVRLPSSAVSFRYGMDAEAEGAAARLGLSLTWLERFGVRHEDMPSVLSKYSYFIDMRRPPSHRVARSLGRAALEALACGCKVVDWAGDVHGSLPQQNHPESVADRWHGIYLKLLDKTRRNTLL